MSLITTYIKQQAAKKAPLQTVVDEPNNNRYAGALACLAKQSNPSNPNSVINSDMIDKVKRSWAKDADLLKQVTDVPTMVTARSFTVNGPANTSSLIQVTPAYIGSSMTLYPSQHMNNGTGELNMVTMVEEADRKLSAVMNGIKNAIEDAALAKLQAIKTKVLDNQLNYTFEGDSVIATNAQRLDIVSALDTLIRGNNYDPGEVLDVVGDAGAMQVMRDIRKFGTQNQKNEAQYLDGKEFFLSNRLPSGIGKEATMFVVPMGSFGILFRVQPLAANGYDEAYDWKFDTFDGRGYGIPTDQIEILEKTSGANVAAETGNAKDTASAAKEFIIGVEFAIIEQFEASDAGAKTPVLEVMINTAATDADVTAPTVSAVTSSATTELTVAFDSAIAIDPDGDVGIGDATEAQLIAALGITVADVATIESAVGSSDNTELTITVLGTTTAGDLITSDSLYDGAGNKFVANAGQLAKVNAGNTAWEAI